MVQDVKGSLFKRLLIHLIEMPLTLEPSTHPFTIQETERVLICLQFVTRDHLISSLYSI
jgi:hypothetical protein